MYNPQADASVLREPEERGASPPVPGLLQASPEPLSQPSVPPQAMLSRDPGFPQRHGRHTPYVTQPDYRLYELNKRLQARTEESDSLWWDAFATEFFEDDATLTLCFCLEDGPKRYTIGRTLIPRYFRSIFDGGVSELYFTLRNSKESFHNNAITLDCEQCCMVSQHGKPMFIKLCVILEPMQELMSRHKTYNISPRDCLKTCLFQKWQRMVAPPAEPSRPPAKKRRKRNNSASSTSNSSIGQNNGTTKKKSPASSNFSLASQGGRAGRQDVMVVGEPTLMGGEFGDEDERLITRLENTQYDAANGLDDDDDFGHSPALANSSPWSGKPPTMPDIKTENPTSQASQ
uniref:LIM domain-binding protein 2-like isoform X6 n=1 Tax=Myxine glutinosa TaxID=7769 RepID=UPI00358DF46E